MQVLNKPMNLFMPEEGSFNKSIPAKENKLIQETCSVLPDGSAR
jgi:hypothetical protein